MYHISSFITIKIVIGVKIMSKFKTLFGLMFIQLFFATVLILLVTAMRFFDSKNFDEFKSVYSSYASFDTDTSLVYDGESS